MSGIIDVQAISIWRFEDAPTDLRAIATEGDEAWIALVPKARVNDMYLGWLDRIDANQTPQVIDHPSLSDYQVWIGAHA